MELLKRKSTDRFVVAEDAVEQLIGDGFFREREVDDVDARQSLWHQQRTIQPRRQVQTKPVGHLYLLVADSHPPFAALRVHDLSGDARYRPIERLVDVLDQQRASHRRGVLQVTVEMLVIRASNLKCEQQQQQRVSANTNHPRGALKLLVGRQEGLPVCETSLQQSQRSSFSVTWE